MTILLNLLDTADLAPALEPAEAGALATELEQLSGLRVYPRSLTAMAHSLLFLGRRDGRKFVGVLGAVADRFKGEATLVPVNGQTVSLNVAPANPTNAVVLRALLPYLKPQTLGLRKSAGCGDRLGLATPGHIRAIRQHSMAPIVAQQSMRENARTGRTPQEVVDDAMWGVFQEGWREGYGADADHLKTTADIDLCAAAGYTFYTIDPGAYVDDTANTAPLAMLEQKVDALPWNILAGDRADLEARLADKTIELGQFSFTLDRELLLRAAAKYGQAVAHTVVMYRHLLDVCGAGNFELEMSVDETETVTSLAEHVYIVNELRRLEVEWVSLAPRYVGTFEKGVDYIGDLAKFEESFSQHAAVAQAFGPYKLSLHSGSDKFSVYPIARRVAGELVHLKTAGTSYLEALRAIAKLNPALFRQIVAFGLERYPTDRATYHVSAEVAKVPDAGQLADAGLVSLLDDFHAREVLHVTFGSVLNHEAFRQPFFDTLRANEETYTDYLEAHFHKHLAPFD
ncbi:MAG: hypothetical protein FOGNACKC_04891 [Anaerolineae bacterium]|nr:hypothetical protein [Anaerolineae bacterium]